jgi:hypothetical protein
MNLEIIQHKKFKDNHGSILNNYKVFYKSRGIWISDKDFKQYPGLLSVDKGTIKIPKLQDGKLTLNKKNTDVIILKEPIDELYHLIKKKNKKGEFLVLQPKITIAEAKEPEVIYETKKTNVIEIINLEELETIGALKDDENIELNLQNNKTTKGVIQNQTAQNIKDNKSEKILFINNLLDYSVKKKVDNNTRERLFSLIGKEVGKSGLSKEDVEKIVEDKLTGRQIEKKNKTFKTQHAPIEMVRFLHKFSIDENFKWFTHAPDNPVKGFNCNEYIKNANELLPIYPQYAKRLLSQKHGINVNFSTYQNIRNFIFNTGYPCSTDKGRIKYTWSDLEEWCKNNPNAHPFNAEIGENVFSKYINQFKNIIEFRNDNEDFTFLTRVQDFIVNKLGTDFNVFDSFIESFEKIGKTLNVYMDTNLFFKGLGQILSWITQNKAKSNIIEFSLFDESDYYQFEIFHKGSYISYSPDSTKINGQQGDFDKARKNLFCVVDWEIQASFKYNGKIECFLITCLDKDVYKERNGSTEMLLPNTVKQLSYDIDGIKHILKLFKTK